MGAGPHLLEVRMTEIARQDSRAIAVEPVLSPPVLLAIREILEPHPDLGFPTEWPAALQTTVQAPIAALTLLCAPVGMRQLREWANPIGPAVRNPPTQDDFRVWLAALYAGCKDMASGAFAADSQQACLLTFKFFPAVADVAEVVKPRSMALRAKLRALQIIAAGRTAAIPSVTNPSTPYTSPDWVGERKAKWDATDGARPGLAIQPPVLTIEDQLRALGFDPTKPEGWMPPAAKTPTAS